MHTLSIIWTLKINFEFIISFYFESFSHHCFSSYSNHFLIFSQPSQNFLCQVSQSAKRAQRAERSLGAKRRRRSAWLPGGVYHWWLFKFSTCFVVCSHWQHCVVPYWMKIWFVNLKIICSFPFFTFTALD